MRGEVAHRAITIPEGRTIEEIAAIVAAQGLDAAAFLEAASDPTPVRDIDAHASDLEGYLFPDTYDVAQTPDAARLLVGRMTQRFRAVVVPELARGSRSRGSRSGSWSRSPRSWSWRRPGPRSDRGSPPCS